MVAQVGIAGSTTIGSNTILAGQVGLAGHLKIGNNVTVAAQSGVMRDIPDGGKWLGAPAQPDRQAKRQMIALQRLPELIQRVGELERKAKRPPLQAKGIAAWVRTIWRTMERLAGGDGGDLQACQTTFFWLRWLRERGCGSMVECGLPKPETRVRFPSPAPLIYEALTKYVARM